MGLRQIRAYGSPETKKIRKVAHGMLKAHASGGSDSFPVCHGAYSDVFSSHAIKEGLYVYTLHAE